MGFKIEITEIKTVRKMTGPQWTQVRSEAEAAELRRTFLQETPKDDLPSVYGYAPEIEKSVETTTKVLEQTVETLDLAAVIKAINKL